MSFRTIESSPRLPQGLSFVTVKSAALGQRADLTLWSPPGTEPGAAMPLVILLHGVYGSHWAWALKGNAHLTAQRLIDSGTIPPMRLAMPSDGLWGDGSGYVAHATGQDFERWIVEEVTGRERPPLATRRTGQEIVHQLDIPCCLRQVDGQLGDGAARVLQSLALPVQQPVHLFDGLQSLG